MSDKQVSYDITANSTGFVAAMEQCAQAVTGASNGIKSKMDGVGHAFEAVQKQLVMIAGVVAGGAFFKEAIAGSVKLASEQAYLAKRLGISGEGASALHTALGDIYSDSDTYIGAFDKFAKQLKSNEAGLQAMGLQTRDSNGHLRDSKTLFTEALQIVGEYKPGLDQTTAAMTLFGKGVDDVMKLQKLNNDVTDEAKAKNKALGMTLTQEGLASSKAYKAAMNDVGDVLEAVKNTVGKAVMPVFTEMGNYFAKNGPHYVAVFKGALTVLMAAFRGLQATVSSVMGVIFEMVSSAIDQFGNLGELLSKIFSGDFAGASDVMHRMGDRWSQGIKNVMSNTRELFAEGSKDFGKDMENMWGEGTGVPAPNDKKKHMGDFGKTNEKKNDPAVKSDMSMYEEQLAQARTAAAELDAIHGMSKEAELKYWQDILQAATLKETDRVAVTKKAEEARLRVLQESAQQGLALTQLSIADWQRGELAKIDLDEEFAKMRVGLGTQTAAEMLQQDLAFEDSRFAIRQAAAERLKALADPTLDKVLVAQRQSEITALEQQHQQRIAQIRGQIAVQSAQEQAQIWQDLNSRMSNLWDQGIAAMMNGTLTWHNAMKAVGTELTGWFAGIVKRQVVTWIGGEQGKSAATATGVAQRAFMETWAATKSVALWAATAVKNIMASAWEAMAAAWKAVVGIPYVGPVLAVAAAGAAFAGVSALAGKVSSARGGYDIPAGVNPMTQLHEKEMVLPAHLAEPLRNMIDSGSTGGQRGSTVQLHGMPSDFIRLGDLADKLRELGHNFEFVRGAH